ncbi:hypothetical protein PC129_g8743 [Phytophthora cactorum]|uniref:Uncharacterized protein n=1 Tax=Phytophthora cactorum TaxID=29920 RepID=A0A8T1I864_9STRA|nr:hypothetical protein PC129_g8743 [Phytophthora cactorum]
MPQCVEERADCRGEQVRAQRAALEHARELRHGVCLSVGGVADREDSILVHPLANLDEPYMT